MKIPKKIVFLTEMGFKGKIPEDHPNMRTEFAWMHALDADHHPISEWNYVKGYDCVFIIWPKGKVSLNSEGIELPDSRVKVLDKISPFATKVLKENNKKVFYVQEGPVWFSNDYPVISQVNLLNIINESDAIFCHNEIDKKWYKGIAPNTPCFTMDTLMIDKLVHDIKPSPLNEIIIGGNFCRWYGGFQSYIAALQFKGYEYYVPSMHNKRENEEYFVKVLPYMQWNDWMKRLSTFKVGIHLMPTVAAGTFSLNCAYFGIPVIGNKDVDTQRILHPTLSVDVNDIGSAVELAHELNNNDTFYRECSRYCKEKVVYYLKYGWMARMQEKLNLLDV